MLEHQKFPYPPGKIEALLHLLREAGVDAAAEQSEFKGARNWVTVCLGPKRYVHLDLHYTATPEEAFDLMRPLLRNWPHGVADARP